MKTIQNKWNIGAACLMILIGLNSCKKDITLTSKNSVTVDQYFHNAQDINTALAGLYSSFQEEMEGDGNGKDEGYGGRYHYWGEARSDNFDAGQFGTSYTNELALNSVTNNNPQTDWGGLYRTIARANLCIANFPKVKSLDNSVTTAALNSAMAQAYAMRAECYFYIIRTWGDAPVWKDVYPDISAEAKRPRSPQAMIMDSVIIPDLTQAYNLIPKSTTPTLWYINEGAVCAIMADAYMWRATYSNFTDAKGDYTNAKLWVNNLFKAKGPTGATYSGASQANLEPAATWKNLFLTPASSIEPIWSIHWDYTTNGCACIPISLQLSNNLLKVDSLFTTKWKAVYQTDIRVSKTIDTLYTTGHADRVYKYLPLTPTSAQLTPTSTSALQYNVYLPMYRLADVYLTYAEALAYTGELDNALKYLNFVHTRAGYPTPFTLANLSTAGLMIDQILQEAQYEEFGEGKRWFDLVRTNHIPQVMDPVLKVRQAKNLNGQTGFGDKQRILWPLSRTALTSNPLLVQNPGY
jgi:hypothetical protein